jgi:Ca2+:H+ antiporter
MRQVLRSPLNWLLVFVPAAILLEYFPVGPPILTFVAAALAIIPLASWLGASTEQLSRQTSQAIGGLLNATFGNAAELIIAFSALREGLLSVVKASLTGSIIGNLLLVLGAAALAGGLRHKTQRFNPAAAGTRATMLTLSAIALVVPAAYHYMAGPVSERREAGLSAEISVVLLATYGLSLLFSLCTHRHSFSAGEGVQEEETSGHWSVRKSLTVLAVNTALIAWVSEVLVGSIGEAAASLGMTSIFVGVIVVGILGNAAEHSTAVFAARDNKMDLAVEIAIGSSIQVALFVAPILMLLSYLVGPQPMDLVFSTPEVLAIGLAVWIAGQISGDGETNWLEGVQLLAVYLVLALVFYYLPEPAPAVR